MSKYLPAEWCPQSGVQLTWPHAHSDWAAILSEVEPTFIEIARAILGFESLLIVAYDSAHAAHIQATLHQHNVPTERCHIAVQPGNDTWARDHGPITIIEEQRPVLLDFIFNGWGNKFDASLDNQISKGLYHQGMFGHTSLRSVDFVLEGGSIESDGEGTLLTTSHCLLTDSRNPGYQRNEIEQFLQQQFGIHRILWLDEGELAGDDTDSHIDMLARLCSSDTIAYTSCDDEEDQHYLPLQAMLRQLKSFITANGSAYKLVALPIPAAIYDEDGQRLPASYANFLIINGAVLLPVYADAMDAVAIERLSEIFRDRQIIPIDCRQLIRQYGSLHCLTMQYPAEVEITGVNEKLGTAQ